jgi:hypothetical protein
MHGVPGQGGDDSLSAVCSGGACGWVVGSIPMQGDLGREAGLCIYGGGCGGRWRAQQFPW